MGDTRRDERLRKHSLLRNLLKRPALGAAGGALVVWLVFWYMAGDRGFVSLRGTATYLEVAAELGILSTAVCLLMIGGEFDLSIGSIIGLSGMTLAISTTELGLPMPVAMLLSLALALTIGLING